MICSRVLRRNRAKEGVAIIFMDEVNKKVTSWEPIKSRMLTMGLDVEI